MKYHQLTLIFLLLFAIGCSPPELSKEAKRLQGMSADEVAYTYEAILAMSDSELAANIDSLQEKLLKQRQAMPRSLAGASVGGGSVEANTETEAGTPVVDEPKVSIASMALPLEVMRQVQESRK